MPEVGSQTNVVELARDPRGRRGAINIAYLDPPYSRYFQRLAGRLAQRTGGKVVALLSSPAYGLYTGGDKALVWPPGAMAAPPPLPDESAHALWSQEVDQPYRAVFWHTVQWFRQCFREQGIRMCLVFSDARPFSLAASVAAQGLGVKCLYFERGAYRFRTASLSAQGLNARFSLERARSLEGITGVPDVAVLGRRPQEPWLRLNFLRFIAANAWACGAAPERRLLQHKRYAFGPYVRLALAQWWAERSLSRRGDASLALDALDPIVLIPLQLPSDSQWLLHSPFTHNQEFLDFVVQQARRVAPDVRVIVKRHPMDSARYRMPEGAHAVAGNLTRFYRLHPVVVCINSTVGFEAATKGLSVLCFGDSFYSESPAIARVERADFADRLAKRIGSGRDLIQGRALLADVLRWYQAPGDAWGYNDEDLEATAEIVLQHYRAVPVVRGASGAAQAGSAAGGRDPQPVTQFRKA